MKKQIDKKFGGVALKGHNNLINARKTHQSP